jgi:hypothetical protein
MWRFTSPTSQAATRFTARSWVSAFRIGWATTFPSCGAGVDHHTINLVETGSNKHFHTAFELRDWAHMQTLV